ncbi:MAG: transglutaminase-like domain-containing protein [Candidatus Aminicenantales bacterium]
MRKKFFLVLAVFLAANGLALRLAGEESSSEQWFLVTLAEKPVGYVHETTERRTAGPEPALISTTEMKMVLNRLGSQIELCILSEIEETEEGMLRRTRYQLLASLMASRSEAFIKENAIEVRSEAGGKIYTRTISYSGALLGPEGIRRLSAEHLKNPGDRIEFQTYAPELSSVTQVSRIVLSRETIEVRSEQVPVLKIEEKIETASIVGTVWLDRDYQVVRQEMSTPFGPVQVVLSDEVQALKAAAGETLPEEMYKRSIVRVNVRLPKARSIEYLKVRLIHQSPNLGWPEMNSPYQRILDKTRESLTLEIRRSHPEKPAALPALKTDSNREFLEPNAYIQSDDPEAQSLARAIVGEERDVFKAALMLERWVAENMKFDLGIVLAPSSEILKNRRGTCMGYAMLLATLARAAGIPSRVSIGYAYALGMFGGHAWTEVLVGDEWITLDAALISRGSADAARICLLTSSFYSGVGSMGSGGSQQIFGHVGIQILEYAVSGGKKVAVSEGTEGFRITGNRYENPWLGLSLVKPHDFKFTKLDAVWPGPAVLALEGPEGRTAELQQQYLRPWKNADTSAREILAKLNLEGQPEKRTVAGHSAFILTRSNKAAVVIIDEPEAWVLVTEGKNAPDLLRRITRRMELK